MRKFFSTLIVLTVVILISSKFAIIKVRSCIHLMVEETGIWRLMD